LATLSKRNANDAIVISVVWSVGFCVLRESGVIRSDFVLVRFAGIWLQLL